MVWQETRRKYRFNEENVIEALANLHGTFLSWQIHHYG